MNKAFILCLLLCGCGTTSVREQGVIGSTQALIIDRELGRFYDNTYALAVGLQKYHKQLALIEKRKQDEKNKPIIKLKKAWNETRKKIKQLGIVIQGRQQVGADVKKFVEERKKLIKKYDELLPKVRKYNFFSEV